MFIGSEVCHVATNVGKYNTCVWIDHLSALRGLSPHGLRKNYGMRYYCESVIFLNGMGIPMSRRSHPTMTDGALEDSRYLGSGKGMTLLSTACRDIQFAVINNLDAQSLVSATGTLRALVVMDNSCA